MKPVANSKPRKVKKGDWVKLPVWSEYYQVLSADNDNIVFYAALSIRYPQDRKDGLIWEFKP